MQIPIPSPRYDLKNEESFRQILSRILASLEARIRNLGSGTTMVYSGSGTPEGVVTANVGSLFLRTDGGASTTLYVKESGTGNTGWVAK